MLWLGTLACTPRLVPTGPSEPWVDPAAGDSVVPQSADASTPTDDPWAGCQLDVECGLSDDPGHFAVCESNECVRWTAQQLWMWARTHAPELAQLRDPGALAEVPWIPDTGKLRVFVDARQLIWSDKARCVAIDLEHVEGSLVAEIPEVLGTKPGTKDAWFYRLELGGSVAVLGPSRTTSGPDGEGVRAIGGLQTFGLGLVPAEQALRYTGARYSAALACASPPIERTHCEPRVCSGCTRLEVKRRSLDASVGHAASGATKLRVTGGPCDPCPTDTFGSLLPRLESALANREFVEDQGDDSGPVFHRNNKACLTALKQRNRRLARARRPL